MGNYYSGMMNATGGSELRHHGILGQKWGVRRYQNADGSLTPEGRERYYGDPKEQKKLAGMVTNRGVHKDEQSYRRANANLRNTPQVQNAVKNVSDLAAEAGKAHKELMDIQDEVDNKLWGDPKTHEKWLNVAVDRFMETDRGNGHTREEIYNWFKYDDGDQNEQGTFETYIRESNDPLAKEYSKKLGASIDANQKLMDACRREAENLLGDHANDECESLYSWQTNKMKAADRLAIVMSSEAEDRYGWKYGRDVPKGSQPSGRRMDISANGQRSQRRSIVELAKQGNDGRRELSSNELVKQAAEQIKPERRKFESLRDQRERVLEAIPSNLSNNSNWLYTSNDPRAVKYRAIDKQYEKAFKDFTKAAKKQAGKLTGVSGLQPLTKSEVNMWSSFNVKDQVANAIMYQDLFGR